MQTEIQLVDSDTSRANERGDSSHPLYKKRQRVRVRLRLESQGWNLDSLIDDAKEGIAPTLTPQAVVQLPALARALSVESSED